MDFSRNRTLIMTLAMIIAPPLLEFIPLKIQIFFQLPLCLILTVLFFLSLGELGLSYENALNRLLGKNREPKECQITEIQIFQRLGFHLFCSILLVWLWGPTVASIIRLTETYASRESSIFTAFSFLTAGAIVYLLIVYIVLWILKSRRSQDDYPFLLRPREKTFIIYIGMFILALMLSFIYKRAFHVSVVSTLRDILISAGVIILVGPIINFLRLLIFYKVRWLNKWEEFLDVETAAELRALCKLKKIRPPRIGVLEDDAPINAFTFGYGPFLAWVVVARGMKKALSREELKSVLMHEFGHIGHWDFWAKAAPAIILASLFQIFSGSVPLLRVYTGNTQATMILISIFVINYAVYALQKYLSRTREYYADEFSGEGSGDPDNISYALAKITYGLSGPVNRPEVSVEDIQACMKWDLKSLWGRMLEFLMTHPLTANRIRYMAVLSARMGRKTAFSIATDRIHRYFAFILDIIVQWAFSISLLFSIVLCFHITKKVMAPYFIGSGAVLLLTTLYQFPLFFGFPLRKIRKLAQDLRTSPVYGTPVKIVGEIIGRRVPAAKLCHHPVIEDESGFVATNYELITSNFIPRSNSNFWMNYLNPLFIYHLFLGFFKMPDWIGQKGVEIIGWYRRTGSRGYIEILKMSLNGGETYRSYSVYVLILLSLLMIGVGGLYLAGF